MSSHDCPFCHLETEADRTVDQTELSIVILSDPRRARGHLLVIPRRHIERPWDLTLDERYDVMELLLKYQQLICETTASGCDVQENYRPHHKADGYYKVDHIHYHLLPRAPGDALETEVGPHIKRIMGDLPNDERDEMLRVFRG